MTNIAMEHHHAIKFGKPSISMGHLYHGYVSHNQMIYIYSIYIYIKIIINHHKRPFSGWCVTTIFWPLA